MTYGITQKDLYPIFPEGVLVIFHEGYSFLFLPKDLGYTNCKQHLDDVEKRILPTDPVYSIVKESPLLLESIPFNFSKDYLQVKELTEEEFIVELIKLRLLG